MAFPGLACGWCGPCLVVPASTRAVVPRGPEPADVPIVDSDEDMENADQPTPISGAVAATDVASPVRSRSPPASRRPSTSAGPVSDGPAFDFHRAEAFEVVECGG